MASVIDLFAGAADQVRKRLPGSETTGDSATTIRNLDERLQQAKEARRPYEGQWLLNLSFFFGKQWVIFSQALQQLDKPQVEPWRVMPNINFIRPSVLTAYAKIIQSRQIPRTQPAGTSSTDEANARACDKLIEYLDPVAKAEIARNKGAIWKLITGTTIRENYWDKNYGPEIGQDPETGDVLHLGEVQECNVNPFEFYPEPGVEEIEDMEWCFRVTLRPASYIKKTYGIDVDEAEYDSSLSYQAQLNSIISDNSSRIRGVVLKEYFERENVDNPQGRYVVYVNDNIIYDDPAIYPKLPLPFIKEICNPRPGSFWGVGMVDDMVDPQRIYNKTKGESIEIQRLMSKPKWMKPIGSMPEGKEITNAPGEEVPYLPVQGLKPEPVKGEDIPAGYFKLMEQTEQELYNTSGQHEVSRGQSPFTRTATGIAYLQEADDERLAPAVRSFDRAYEQSAEHKLILAQQFYKEDRLLNIVGQDNKVEVLAFSASQIPDNPRVRIQAGGQALPRSRVARQDLLLKLWTAKPPIIDDPALMVKLFEFGEIEGLYADIKQHIAQAERENATMLGTPTEAGGQPTPGQPVKVRNFHNHPVHIKEHNKVRNSLQYEQLDEAGQRILDQHVEEHQLMYAEIVANANLGGGGNSAEDLGGNRSPGAPSGPTGMGDLFEQTAPTPAQEGV